MSQETDTEKAVKPNYRAMNSRKQVKFSDHSIDAMLLEATDYPAEVHEPIRWLAGYCREKCNSKLDVLEAQCRRLGLNTSVSKTYFTKVLNGSYWAIDPKTGKRLGSIDNFLQTIEALKGDDLAATRAGRVPFIMTPTAQMIFDYIDMKRLPDTVCKFGLIVGATGMQKTATLKHYVMNNNHGATVMIESPHNGSLTVFLRDLAMRYSDAKSYVGSKLIANIYENVNARKTIIVENVQRLYDDRKGWNQPVFNFLQKLQDDTGCTIILTCTVDFMRTFRAGRDKGYFEQFEGRCGGARNFLILDEYPARSDVRMIAETFGLQDIDAALPSLEKHCRNEGGRIRLLFDALQQGARLANAEESPLTLEHLEL